MIFKQKTLPFHGLLDNPDRHKITFSTTGYPYEKEAQRSILL